MLQDAGKLNAGKPAVPGPLGEAGRINGVIDLPQPNRAGGWAIDRADPEAHVIVEIYRDGRKIGEAPADTYRADLERGGIGTGRYGFSVPLDAAVPPGLEFTVTALARTRDGVEGPLRPIGATLPAEDPERRRLQEICLALARSSATAEPDESQGRLARALDRLEAPQARLERQLAEMPQPGERGLPAGLKLAVALALGFGVAALGLGLNSLYRF